MPSLISQMRNEMAMPQSPSRQQRLNKSIENTRQLMNTVRMSPNPQAALAQLLQNSPYAAAIHSMLQNGNSLQSIAQQLATQENVDLNSLINQLQSGL